MTPSPPHPESLQPFPGFAPGKAESVRVPEPFFSQLLPLIDDLGELRLTVYCFWALQQREGEFRYLRRQDMIEDALLLTGFDRETEAAIPLLDESLRRATARGTLLHILIRVDRRDESLFFMNTERGRRAVAALERGDWKPGADALPVMLVPARPNLFALYEQNIGPLTPLIADTLKDAEQTYPQPWLEEAIQIAVERNIRSWRYVESILKRWFSEGKSDGKTESKSISAHDGKDRGASGADRAYGGYERFWDDD